MRFEFVFFITRLLCLENFKTLFSLYGLPLVTVMCSCRKYPWPPTEGNGNSRGRRGSRKGGNYRGSRGLLTEVFFYGVWIRLLSCLSNRPHFLWVYRRDNPRGMLGEHEKSSRCKSLAFGSWFTSISSVLPTSQVGYHAGKPIESVGYCFYKITLK